MSTGNMESPGSETAEIIMELLSMPEVLHRNMASCIGLPYSVYTKKAITAVS